MKADELKKKSEELAEMAEKASRIETAILKAQEAQYYVEDALQHISEFTCEPHGWASENWGKVVIDLETMLEQLE